MDCDDIQDLKSRFTIPFLWSHFSLPDKPAKNCRSPFREDKNPSFSVWQDSGGNWRWKDFATDEGGDVIDFVAKANGYSKGEAISYLRQFAGERTIQSISKQSEPKETPDDCPVNFNEVAEEKLNRASLHWICFPKDMPLKLRGLLYCRAAAEHLRYNTHLRKEIAAWKGISDGTVRALAADPSLGYIDGKWCFIYETGVKTRQGLDVAKEERIIHWEFGVPFLWRGFQLTDKANRDFVETVYLTEGESDCMVLIDHGFETAALKSICIAVPSASTFPERWAHLFRGKNVIVCMDNDEAGNKCRDRLKSLLIPVAKKFGSLDLAALGGKGGAKE